MVQLKSRHNTFKGTYGIISRIVKTSGMGSVPQGKPKSWAAWRNKRYPQYDICESLFRGVLATGDYAVASSATFMARHGVHIHDSQDQDDTVEAIASEDGTLDGEDDVEEQPVVDVQANGKRKRQSALGSNENPQR
ncbi:Aste57867_6420 [Aphanomyces stellatus]|uniref:Aste57867_6420 protein n=1 Tax=Aphanomyces stellatus TaxID=120398 RepID=A0A485KER2_9STRA|nr:hypothetical protein As57867_006405 [Aphanomyces stellatus]VFT83413.1 Aste57867_6420 [Aphanomyces stellatus]